ncbi:lamin tail domain-containing protein [Solirubrobacter sp. CPCC 204708]|uniref:Lamin tail domain-containing protein n=1 Tax=Solirubrobacter deserti TaxID=2282478 RepID=A0ABT4RSW2_9ACTN|nr:lamin tail domain-containing protein [Solirubrobacter deserti]MBE2316271.1 lamin tail domain-containing protein [Solirubrobacter deserti]MDA0141478.1 lamin tail domain-containing protein [Solirubrobacter deserti]
MKPRLLAIAAAALAAVAVAAPAAQAASDTVVIQGVAFRGPTGGNDEYIQIKNISSAPQNIGEWEIFGSNAGGTSVSSRAKIPAGVTLPAGKSYLFTNVQPGTPTGGSYSGTVPGDQIFTTGVGDTGGIQLRNAAGTVIDAVGHTGVVAAYREGTGLAFPTANGNNAFLRKSTAPVDTDNNANDFVGPQAFAPENCGTACQGGGEPTEGCQPVPAVTPITSVQTLGTQSACNGTRVRIKGIVTGIDNLYGSSYDAIYKGDSGLWIQEATRPDTATTSSAIFVAGIRRAATNPEDVIGREVVIEGRANAKFGQVEIVPDGVGSTTCPCANEVDLSAVAVSVSTDKKPLPAPVVLDQTQAENQGIARNYYRALQGMRVTLPVGIATGGGTTKFRDVFVEPGTDATRLFRKNDAAAISTPWHDAPAELGISPDGGAGNPADPRLPWRSTTQVDLDLFDVVRNVTGPLSYSYSYFKIVPQLTGAPAPAVERGPINAAYPPAVPTPAENTLRVASFNVENLFPVGKSNDGHVITQEEYNERVRTLVLAIRNFLKEPDVIAVQEVAVFADGANALTGLAAALGNYTGYIATNNDERGIATGFLVKDGTTATGGKVVGAEVPAPAAWQNTCDLWRANGSGKLFDRAPYQLELKKGDLSFVALSNHWASQTHENRCRIDEAAYVREAAAALQQQGRNVLVTGDLNDFEFSEALSTLAGGNVLANLWTKAPAGQAYSYKFNGHLQTLDHIFVSAGLESRVTDFRYVHFDNDYYERPEGDGTGISDHDPPVVTFELAKGASVSQPSNLTGSVPATLALTIGDATLGTFIPGIPGTYDGSLTAQVTSTGADATLSVLDASSTATGRLVNGTHALRSPVQVNVNDGAFAPLRTDNGPLTLISWNEPVASRAVQVGFKQSIAADEGLRTGSYGKTLTFTLSTTAP